jgi:hypothetical protein
MTSPTLLRRSGWLVGGLVTFALAGLAITQWLATQAETTRTAVAASHIEAQLESLARSFTLAEQTALAATVPTEADLSLVYPSLEALAARHGVTLNYNFGTTPEQDPALVQAEAAKDSWVIPIDWLGNRNELEAILTELETSPYLIKLHSYRFDVLEPSESVLSTTLILYGK